jgi:hypothetical protein
MAARMQHCSFKYDSQRVTSRGVLMGCNLQQTAFGAIFLFFLAASASAVGTESGVSVYRANLDQVVTLGYGLTAFRMRSGRISQEGVERYKSLVREKARILGLSECALTNLSICEFTYRREIGDASILLYMKLGEEIAAIEAFAVQGERALFDSNKFYLIKLLIQLRLPQLIQEIPEFESAPAEIERNYLPLVIKTAKVI